MTRKGIIETFLQFDTYDINDVGYHFVIKATESVGRMYLRAFRDEILNDLELDVVLNQ